MFLCPLFVVLILDFCRSNEHICSYTTRNATYNLETLRISSNSDRNYHLVHDADPLRNYSYFFNFCQSVNQMPFDICTNASKRPGFAQGYCKPHSYDAIKNECPAEDIRPINQNVFAYQVDNSKSECYRLSNEAGGPPQWQLYDSNDPSAGIVIKLTNGDYSPFCKDESKNREIDLILRCHPERVGLDLSNAATIIEDADKSACHYRMELDSIWGCPTQCGIYNNALCNNRGICSYDFSNHIPKCFCFGGYYGDGCQIGNDQDKKEMNQAQDILVATGLKPSFTINGANIEYDLSDIDALNKVIDDHETSNGVQADYRYYFQFEQVIDPKELPIPCKVALLSCDFSQDAECQKVGMNNNSIGVAYRVDNYDKSCVVLGEISHFTSTLFDEKLPAKGISIRYEGGYYAQKHTNYQFHINLECPNMAPEDSRNDNKINGETLEVTKYDDSTFAVHFITPLACPSVCSHTIADELVICNGRGLCALDPFDQRTKCLCDDGWEGTLCTVKIPPPVPHSDTLYIALTVILIVTLAVVTMTGISMYMKWKQRANIAEADLALLNHGDIDLTNGLMRIRDTDPDDFMLDNNTYGNDDDVTDETVQ